MDSKPTIPPITRRQKEKYKKGISYVYCMYCCKPHLFKDLAIREGRYDVCRSPECMDLYRKERKIALENSKNRQRRDSLGENNDDASWLNGDTIYE